MLDAACSGVFHLLSDEPYVIQVAIVTGFHLFPFRTEKLSPSAPMVLHTRGRVGSRRFQQDPSEAILEGLLRCKRRLLALPRSGTFESVQK